MAIHTAVLPSLGDEEGALAGGKVAFWLAEEGQKLVEGCDLLEIETDKAAFVVPCPVSGTLKRKLVHEDDEVKVGAALCEIETD